MVTECFMSYASFSVNLVLLSTTLFQESQRRSWVAVPHPAFLGRRMQSCRVRLPHLVGSTSVDLDTGALGLVCS